MNKCIRTICFTGFNKARKIELMDLADSKGLEVKSDFTKDLVYLCYGPNAGPSKMDKARANGATLLSEAEFESLYADVSGRDSAPAETPVNNSSSVPGVSIYDEHEMLDYLWSCIDRGEKVSIIYHGGSSSGEKRNIIPLGMEENFILRAVDISDTARRVKAFSLGKVEVDGLERFSHPENNNKKKSKKTHYQKGLYHDIADIHDAFNDTLIGMGWHVATYSEDGECYRLDVCGYFKNGKPRKTPIVTLYYEPLNLTKPFVCKCELIEFATAYTYLDSAAERFISLADDMATVATVAENL